MSFRILDITQEQPRPLRARTTGAHATRFEIAKIVALRAAQIAAGAAMEGVASEFTARSHELYMQAHDELRRRELPVRIGRPRADGSMIWVSLQHDLDIDRRAYVEPHVHMS